MNYRITYSTHDHYEKRDTWVISDQTFTSSRRAKYRILLDLQNKQFFIRNERTKVFVKKSKVFTNMNSLKRAARRELGRLGVSLGKESRRRTFGLCKKGTTQQEWMKQNILST